MKTKSVVLIPGRNDLYRGIYSLARKLNCDTITVNLNKVKNLIAKGLVKQVIIINGSSDHSVDTAYSELKTWIKGCPHCGHRGIGDPLPINVKFTLVDSRPWRVRKPDRSVLMPGPSTEKLIKKILN